jgi:hypothetical protein
MKKTKQVNVLKHFNDQFDARVKKFMDGGTAGVASSYNPLTGNVTKNVGKSYMSPNPAPAFKKGGMKKYQDGGGPKPSEPSKPVSNTPMSKEDFRKAKQARKQQNKLDRIGKRGSGVNIDKVAKVMGAIGAGVSAAAGIKNLFKKNSGSNTGGNNAPSGPPLRKGGSIKRRK